LGGDVMKNDNFQMGKVRLQGSKNFNMSYTVNGMASWHHGIMGGGAMLQIEDNF